MEQCPSCWKTLDLCQCATLKTIENRIPVLLLQHPQEPDKELGSARLSNLILRNSSLKVGLSSPNLKNAVESGFLNPDLSPALSDGLSAPASDWIVLYLGAKYKFNELKKAEKKSDLYFFDKNDNQIERPLESVRGVVAIDGTWAQAKTMWWRNPWLLKLTRAVLDPRQTSMYGKLRKEPRRESLSTIEALAYTLETLGEDPAVSVELLSSFRRLLQRFRDRKIGGA